MNHVTRGMFAAALVIVALAGGPALAQSKEAADADRFVNVRLELSITDQTNVGEPVKKAVTLLLANGGDGRVRSQGMIFREATPTDRRSAFEVTLNADAHIMHISGDKVRANITVEYAPSTAGGDAADVAREQRGSTLNQSVSVALTSGRPTVIVESSDPLSDRKVTLEATATILR